MQVSTVRVAAGRGVGWVGEGWRTFAASPGMWLVLTLVWILLNVALQAVPFVGTLVAWFLAPTLAGGLLLAAGDVRRGRQPDLECLFRPLVDAGTRNPMLILGALFLGANLLATAAAFTAFVTGAGGAMLRQHGGALPMDPAQVDPSVLFAIGGIFLLIGLLLLALLLLVTLLFFFAIPLVAFERMQPGAAIGLGLRGLLRNWAPLTLLGLLYIPLSLVATLPLLLGWLVLIPMTFGTWHAAYLDVFRPSPTGAGDGAGTPVLPPIP
ncbi:MAG: BPSS1780 family membrane protein [Halofilum sp. (in: g-proteobacteria)]|nr:BPSS1780 family membrane protein [Halofilum sp. (in: g-proteobacteria)]